MIKAEVLDAMLSAGCTAEQIVAAVKASMTRSTGAERQARYRARKAQESVTIDVTLRNSDASDAVSPSPLCPPDKEAPKPQEINPPISPQPLRRASRLSNDFAPDLDFAVKLGLSLSQAQNEFAKFRDYWQAKGGKDAAKLDWDATWRNWVRSAAERMPRGLPPRKPSTETGNPFFDRIQRNLQDGQAGREPRLGNDWDNAGWLPLSIEHHSE